jgi:hypothetical protein
MKNCLATGTKIWKDNGVTETFRLAKEVQLNPGEVRYKLLLDQLWDGQPARFLAAEIDNVKLLEELWVLVKGKGNPEEIKYNLLLAKKTNMVRLLCTWQQKAVWWYWRKYGLFLRKPNLTKRNETQKI